MDIQYGDIPAHFELVSPREAALSVMKVRYRARRQRTLKRAERSP
jgi:hypothetical protein